MSSPPQALEQSLFLFSTNVRCRDVSSGDVGATSECVLDGVQLEVLRFMEAKFYPNFLISEVFLEFVRVKRAKQFYLKCIDRFSYGKRCLVFPGLKH